VNTPPYGFRVVGHKASKRRVVVHADALAAYCDCDDRAEIEREGYLSHFIFGQDFRDYVEQEGAEKGYDGPCGASWLWWDVDRPGDLATALFDAARLSWVLLDRYRELDDDDLLVFLSGGKGAHVGLPCSILGSPKPSPTFHSIARRYAERVAERANVVIDTSLYSKVRLLRAPNSRHPATGLHKRRLTLDELMRLKPEAVVMRAQEAKPVDLPTTTAVSAAAVADWRDAERVVERRNEQRQAMASGPNKLNALTLSFIREGAPVGDRHRLLFSAAANLAEFGCPPDLAHALLTEPGLDTGLPPSEVRRQIECGLAHGGRQAEGGAA
jgi:hypothetical protein